MEEYIISIIGTAAFGILAAFGLLSKLRKILLKVEATLKSFAKIIYDINEAAEDHVLDETEVKQILKDYGVTIDGIKDLIDSIISQ